MKIIGLSGAQGAGKSSLLAELQARGCMVDDFKVSRAVQQELGWSSLDTVMSNWHTMVDFQERVFIKKFENELKLQGEFKNSNVEFMLTERTFADITAYTNHWVWEFVDSRRVTFNEAVNWLHKYTNDCTTAQTEIYAGVILLPYMPDVITWENDKNRADEKSINSVFIDIERFLDLPAFLRKPKLMISAKSISDRADQVQTFLAGLK